MSSPNRSLWPILLGLVVLLPALSGQRTNCIPVEPETIPCETNADCAESSSEGRSYCAQEPGVCGESGVCEDRPVVADCPRLWAPVCGCDGVSYDNECFAAVAGASVDHEGECEPARCWGDEMCGPRQYCFFETCAQETGGCEPRPDACYDLWAPVCGCNGETYSNDCYAAAAGASVDHEGECRPSSVE